MGYTRSVNLRSDLIAQAPADFSPTRARLRGKAVDLAVAENLFDGAAYSYEIVAITAPPGALIHAGGELLEAPRLVPESGELTALGCGAGTVGPRLDARVSALFAARQGSLAMALDGLANEMLFAVIRRMQDRMLAECNRKGLTMAGELRAGDPGLDLSAQTAVLRLAKANRVGIATHGGGLLTPMKTLTTILGIGRNLPKAEWSRCDSCRFRDKCKLVPPVVPEVLMPAPKVMPVMPIPNRPEGTTL